MSQRKLAIQITSAAFDQGGTIPAKYTCSGDNVSPPLKWSGLPPGTSSLSLICDDPDAPSGTFVHWVLYGLPSSAAELPEAVPAADRTPDGVSQGTNDFGRVGYAGPCPPRGHGVHRYYFKLYALDSPPQLKPRATKRDLLRAMEGHVLAEGELIGRFERK